MKKLFIISALFLTTVTSAENIENSKQQSSYRELSVSKKDAHIYQVEQVQKNIKENVENYFVALDNLEKAKTSYDKIKVSKIAHPDQIFEKEDNYIAAKKQVTYYLGNIHYLEGHLYNLNHKDEKQKYIEEKVAEHLKSFKLNK